MSQSLIDIINEFIERLYEVLGLKRPEEKVVEYKPEVTKVETREKKVEAKPPEKPQEIVINRCGENNDMCRTVGYTCVGDKCGGVVECGLPSYEVNEENVGKTFIYCGENCRYCEDTPIDYDSKFWDYVISHNLHHDIKCKYWIEVYYDPFKGEPHYRKRCVMIEAPYGLSGTPGDPKRTLWDTRTMRPIGVITYD